jgi:hypothetical protein
MGAIINVFSVPNVALTPTFVVTSATGTNLGAKAETFTFVGWTTVAVVGSNPGGAYGPSAAMGTLVSGNPGLTGVPILGAYSNSQASVTTTSGYGVVVLGTVSSGFTNLSVAGTNIGGAPTYQSLNSGSHTYIWWSRADTTSLFTGSNITVVVS